MIKILFMNRTNHDTAHLPCGQAKITQRFMSITSCEAHVNKLILFDLFHTEGHLATIPFFSILENIQICNKKNIQNVHLYCLVFIVYKCSFEQVHGNSMPHKWSSLLALCTACLNENMYIRYAATIALNIQDKDYFLPYEMDICTKSEKLY